MEWRHINTSLPDEDQRVLVYGILEESGDISKRAWLCYFRPRYNKLQWMVVETYGKRVIEVEYWMPLPLDPFVKREDNGD